MHYILLIHANNTEPIAAEAWNEFIASAHAGGSFRGGSSFGQARTIGAQPERAVADALGGFMRFEAEDPSELEQMLAQHPVVLAGGSLELIEMPRS